MFFFLVGELTAKGANLKGLVQIRDLHFDFKQNFATLTGVLSHGSLGKELCPVLYFTCYSSIRGSSLGRCFADGSPVKNGQFTQQLRQALTFVGLIPPNTSFPLSKSAPLLGLPKKAYQMHKFASLVAGNPTHFNYAFRQSYGVLYSHRFTHGLGP